MGGRVGSTRVARVCTGLHAVCTRSEGRSRYEAERGAALEVKRERFEFLTAHAGEVLRGEDWPELERLFGVVKTR